MKLTRNTYYVISQDGTDRFCTASIDKHKLTVQFPYLHPPSFTMDVSVMEDTPDYLLLDAYDSTGAYLGDLTIRRIKRTEPLLSSIGIDGSKCESDDEADAYVYIYFDKSRSGPIMKVKT